MAAAEADLVNTAAQAWLYGYPLVLMDLSREAMTARVPVNRFDHMREFPDDTFTDVVTPNADTLYSQAWLDLGPEPMVLSVPDMGDRYWMMPVLSAWTDVFTAPGSRTTGRGDAHYAITGPGWTGTLPDGVTGLPSPTALAWLIGRIATAGAEDRTAVHRLQDRLRLTPLSAWTGDPDTRPPEPAPRPGAPAAAAPADRVSAMDGAGFFTRLNRLMAANPPKPDDAPALERFAVLGVTPGGDPAALSRPEVVNAVHAAPEQGQALLSQGIAAARARTGWTVHRGLGDYGTDYGKRAMVARLGLGANLDADAIYPSSSVDADGRPLTGQHAYLLRFEPGGLPPAKGFWSLSMYNDKHAFAANPLHRFAIGDRDDLRTDPDGSLAIRLQHDRPAGPANWLPAPAGSFSVVLRVYWPDAAALNGDWRPPAIQRVS
ncbi:DUF1254 domain-containing protein [Actinomadura macrotermitis]|uniref:DUF1254 domain-containing protein n=1 Tax=Actinomadura macrotermitis TaxID=2585200 RepID=A0A7K0BSB3_9ACTN|nr:DUF1254 domain-containing protein [Actinomadura macrotermitis]MQY04088.1 hypothetical protein [Actinomadura macrotermitis]